jgi:hypothetical protein
VSERTREPWSAVWAMEVTEFLNTLCYCRDLAAKRKQDIEQWQRMH